MNQLKDVINKVKVERNIPLKTIIAECECSRTHFNKVISGERNASVEFQELLAQSLRIEPSELSELLKQSFNQKNSESKRQGPSVESASSDAVTLPLESNAYKLLSLCLAACLLTIGVFYVANNAFSNVPVKNTKNIQANVNNKISVIEGDAAKFIKDVTIPDGTILPQHFAFTKTWRIKNTGSVEWTDRYFTRITMQSPYICSSADMVKIPKTLPGETVDISVDFVTQEQNGSCMVNWVITDKEKTRYFPTLKPKYLLVMVSNIDDINKG